MWQRANHTRGCHSHAEWWIPYLHIWIHVWLTAVRTEDVQFTCDILDFLEFADWKKPSTHENARQPVTMKEAEVTGSHVPCFDSTWSYNPHLYEIHMWGWWCHMWSFSFTREKKKPIACEDVQFTCENNQSQMDSFDSNVIIKYLTLSFLAAQIQIFTCILRLHFFSQIDGSVWKR